MAYCRPIKSDQLSQNTKNEKEILELCVPKNTYNRFLNYTTEKERLVVEAENEASKLRNLKEASRELIKNWDNSVVNIRKKRKSELLSRKKKVEDEKIKLIKKLAENSATERAVIVKEARKLLMYKKPQCRLINSALFTSECFRELSTQIEFNKMMKDMEKNEERRWIEKMKVEDDYNRQEEQKKVQDQRKKIMKYRDDLTKQISLHGSHTKQVELQELEMDKDNLNQLLKELDILKKSNAEELLLKKKKLRDMFLESIESKKRYQEDMKKEEKQLNCLEEAYRKAKEHLTDTTQKKWKELQDQKLNRSEFMAQRCAVVNKYDEAKEQELLEKAINENERKELAKAKAKKDHEENIRAEIVRYQTEFEQQKEQNKQKKDSVNAWGTFQRIKRDEFNKSMKRKEMERIWEQKMNMANELKKQMDERKKGREEERIKNDDSFYKEVAMQKLNEKILAYGQEVLDQSKGVRPLFPIIKTIQNFKKENRLLQPAKIPGPTPPREAVTINKKATCQQQPNDHIFHIG